MDVIVKIPIKSRGMPKRWVERRPAARTDAVCDPFKTQTQKYTNDLFYSITSFYLTAKGQSATACHGDMARHGFAFDLNEKLTGKVYNIKGDEGSAVSAGRCHDMSNSWP